MESELANGALTVIRTEPLPLYMNSGFIRLAGRTRSPIMVEFMEQARQTKARMDSHTAKIRHRFGIE